MGAKATRRSLGRRARFVIGGVNSLAQEARVASRRPRSSLARRGRAELASNNNDGGGGWAATKATACPTRRGRRSTARSTARAEGSRGVGEDARVAREHERAATDGTPFWSRPTPSRRTSASPEIAAAKGFRVVPLKVPSRRFAGTPSCMARGSPVAAALAQAAPSGPTASTKVYSNVTGGAAYLVRVGLIADAGLEARVSPPWWWVKQVRAMHRDGARVFVEFGLRSTLAKLVARRPAGRLARPISAGTRPRRSPPTCRCAIGPCKLAVFGVSRANFDRGRPPPSSSAVNAERPTWNPRHLTSRPVWVAPTSTGRNREADERRLTSSRERGRRLEHHGQGAAVQKAGRDAAL